MHLLMQMKPPKGTLLHYLQWILKNPYPRIPLKNAVGFVGGVTKVLWHRENKFQTQLFIVPPNYAIPEHTHPNVNSYEVYLGGHIRFSHSGIFVNELSEVEKINEIGESVCNWNIIQVDNTHKHGGMFGESGGVFLSVQEWLNNVEPHCVACDYEGYSMNKEHDEVIIHGKHAYKEKYNVNDVAAFEKTEVS